MGAGSSHTSSVPRFRTGNIVTPAVSKATERKSSRLQPGRDFVPGAEALTTLVTRTYWGTAVRRDSLASERANTVPTPVAPEVLAHDQRDGLDRIANVFRNATGRFERTVDMGDTGHTHDLSIARLAEAASTLPDNEPVKVKVGRVDADERKADREARDAAVRAVLVAHGHTGPITPMLRTLALDLIEHARQVTDMGR